MKVSAIGFGIPIQGRGWRASMPSGRLWNWASTFEPPGLLGRRKDRPGLEGSEKPGYPGRKSMARNKSALKQELEQPAGPAHRLYRPTSSTTCATGKRWRRFRAEGAWKGWRKPGGRKVRSWHYRPYSGLLAKPFAAAPLIPCNFLQRRGTGGGRLLPWRRRWGGDYRHEAPGGVLTSRRTALKFLAEAPT